MAEPKQMISMHRDLTLYSGLGGIATIIGLLGVFTEHEVSKLGTTQYFSDPQSKEGFQQFLRILSLFFVIGIILYFLTTVLYLGEKEEVAFDVASLIHQVKKHKAQPIINETAIVSGIGSGVVIISGYYMYQELVSKGMFSNNMALIYSVGWIINAIGLSAGHKALDSIQIERLAWNLPGALAIAAGTYMMPWQMQHNLSSGPAWILMTLGLTSLSIGSSMVVEPEIIS